MAEANKSGKSMGRPARRGGRRRYFRAKDEPANEAGGEKPESNKTQNVGGTVSEGRNPEGRSSEGRNNDRRRNAQRSATQRPSGQRPTTQRSTAQRSATQQGNPQQGNPQRASTGNRPRDDEMEARRARRRRRRGRDRGEITESRQENVISVATLDYNAPQSVFIYTYTSRGDINERYESKVEHFSSIGRNIEDYGIDLSKLIAEDGTIHLPKMNGKISDWEDEPAEKNVDRGNEKQ